MWKHLALPSEFLNNDPPILLDFQVLGGPICLFLCPGYYYSYCRNLFLPHNYCSIKLNDITHMIVHPFHLYV